MLAHTLGPDAVKFFPAGPLGSLAMLRAISAPFPGLRFVPAGGICPANLAEYLGESRVLVVSGSWMATRETLLARDWGLVTAAARAAVAAVTRVRGGRA